MVLTVRDVPGVGPVSTAGVVTQVRARHEGASFGSDTFLIADGVLPAHLQEIAEVTTTFKTRGRRKTVLGVPLPRSKDLPEIDAKAIVKTVGSATKQFAKTSKKVSKDLERAGDQAERIGKILN